MSTRGFWLSIASLLAPLATLLAAVGLDRWETFLQQEASSTFDFSSIVMGAVVADLVMAASLLLLAWLVAFRGERPRAAAAAALIFGILAGAFPWMSINAPRLVPAYNDWAVLRELRVAFLDGGLSSHFTLLVSFLLLVGLLGLLRPVHRTEGIE